jgi:hypothetical protein
MARNEVRVAGRELSAGWILPLFVLLTILSSHALDLGQSTP